MSLQMPKEFYSADGAHRKVLEDMFISVVSSLETFDQRQLSEIIEYFHFRQEQGLDKHLNSVFFYRESDADLQALAIRHMKYAVKCGKEQVLDFEADKAAQLSNTAEEDKNLVLNPLETMRAFEVKLMKYMDAKTLNAFQLYRKSKSAAKWKKAAVSQCDEGRSSSCPRHHDDFDLDWKSESRTWSHGSENSLDVVENFEHFEDTDSIESEELSDSLTVMSEVASTITTQGSEDINLEDSESSYRSSGFGAISSLSSDFSSS